MKAAVCYEFGQPLVVEDLTLDPPQAGEVRVRLAATAICHSDVHLIRGDWEDWGGSPPLVAGHEAAGVVAEVGAGVTRVQPGDHAVVSLLRSCGRCYYCTQGLPHLCEAAFALGSETRLHNRHGQPVRQAIRTAAFAEEVVVHESQVVVITPEMPLDRACLLACGVLTGLGAVTNTAQVPPGSSVVVIGTGGVGLNTVQGARLAGAHPIIAVDVLDSKLAAACAFGATHALNARQANVADEVRALTGGRGADFAFVTIGSTAAVTASLAYVRRQGTVVAVGMPNRDGTANIPVGPFVNDGLRLLGSNLGSARLHLDVPRLVELYRHGRLKLDELITQRYPLSEINAAIEAMERGEALRNVIVFEPPA